MANKILLKPTAWYSATEKQLPSDIDLSPIVVDVNAEYPEIANSGNGGSGTLQEDILYTALVAKINAGTLAKGQQYKITDYATKHYIVDAAGTQYLGTIVTGVTEPLIVTASSANTLEPVAYSALHPEDIIYYDWNPDNWLDDLSFSNTGVIVTGFKGLIYIRYDTLLGNSLVGDFRNCKFRSWKTNAPAYNNGTTYAARVFVTYNNVVYISAAGSNTGNTPATTGSDFWCPCLNLTDNEYWNNNPTSTNGILSGTDFIDTLTFVDNGAATYSDRVRSNNFADYKAGILASQTFADTILSNNVFFLGGNDGVHTNSVDAKFKNNRVFGTFYGNVVGSTSTGNQFNRVFDCYLGNYFKDNIVFRFMDDSLFVSYTSGNIWSSDNVDANTWGSGLINNIFGGQCYNIQAAPYMTNFILTKDVGDKIFAPNVNGSGIDFSSATIIYGSGNATVLKNSAGQLKIQYIDGTTPTVVNANA